MNAAPYQVRTHNASTESENRMHSDDVARQFGFKGGLVPGVTVFSHMTRPMVARYGEAWLARGTAEVTFGKPAYEGELLTINTADNNDASHTLTCLNEQGVELARMSAALPLATTKPDARSNLAPAPPQAERPTVTWDLMAINQPFPALAWSPNGKHIAVAGIAPLVNIYDADTGQPVASCKGHTAGIYALSFTPDSTRLASGGFDGHVRICNPATGEVVKDFVAVPLIQEKMPQVTK